MTEITNPNCEPTDFHHPNILTDLSLQKLYFDTTDEDCVVEIQHISFPANSEFMNWTGLVILQYYPELKSSIENCIEFKLDQFATDPEDKSIHCILTIKHSIPKEYQSELNFIRDTKALDQAIGK